MESTPEPTLQITGTANVRAYGAVGDGKTDDTDAIRKAIAALPAGGGGVVFFPPGHYLTDTVYPPNFMTFKGHSAYGYQEPGGTVISPFKPVQPRLFDLNGRIGVRLEGLTLHGRKMGHEMTGVFLSRGNRGEQHIVIDGCRIESFTGSGISMNEAHVWLIRHSILFNNGLDGIDAGHAFDGWITDCQMAANGRHALQVCNSVAITGCRLEHSGDAGLVIDRYYGQHIQVNGCLFCSNRGPAVEVLEGNVRALAFSGNTFRNSGLNMGENLDRNCHVRFEGVQGLAFTGNALHVLWNNFPLSGMVLKGLVDSVVSNNTLFKGAMRELIRDLGGHKNSVMAPNPGSFKDPKDLDS